MLLFFFGQDSYRLHQESLSERERFFGEGVLQNVRKFDAGDRGEFSWKSFAEAVRDSGLFSQKRCVILDNAFSLLEEEKNKIGEWLSGANNPKDNGDVLCIVMDTKPDKRTTLYKALQKKTTRSQEFPSLSGEEVVRYAREVARKTFPDIVFERGVLERLAAGCGSNLFLLHSELEKVVTHSGSEKKVTEADIETLCSFGVFEDIFRALESISKGDKKGALQFLWRQIKKGEHPIYLLTMCAYQIRVMLLVGECLEKGITVPAVIAREAKIHPFVAQKTIACMRTFTLNRAKKAFQLLGRFDVSVKTGKMDAGLALEEFVLRS